MTGEHVHSPLAFQRPQLSAAAQNPADREAAALRRLHRVLL